ncbi:MAG: single-stranded DNA-binding protein [Acidimicrobiia bacterium]|nr:single-stranded DNA-binding protein [Acidimicrobiia bacterium]
MDLNLVVFGGRLAAPPELRVFQSGMSMMRYLVAVRSGTPSRMDVLPVTLWNPDREHCEAFDTPGDRVWVAGSVQRRFWDDPDTRRSKLEIVASAVEVRDDDVSFCTSDGGVDIDRTSP